MYAHRVLSPFCIPLGPTPEPWHALAQETLEKEAAGQPHAVARLNNVLMQMRKNANHPDLITSAYEQSIEYPPADDLVSQSGKMQLLERILESLKKKGHKVGL